MIPSVIADQVVAEAEKLNAELSAVLENLKSRSIESDVSTTEPNLCVADADYLLASPWDAHREGGGRCYANSRARERALRAVGPAPFSPFPNSNPSPNDQSCTRLCREEDILV